MQRIAIPFLTLSLLIMSFVSKSKEIPINKEYTVYASSLKPLLIVEDHVSEGFLAPLDDGRILLIFRFDPGTKGNHVGSDGFIAKIPYNPEKDEWGKVDTVYNSYQYDDRNIHGGVTQNGRIVTFFRKYDGDKTEGRYFIYSDDNGQTWSSPELHKAWNDPKAADMKGNMATGKMFYNPDIKKYTMLGFLFSWDDEKNYTASRKCITYSKDGASWDEYKLIDNETNYRLNEIAGAWCGKNRVIALQRDDKREKGHPFVQMESYDNGETWTEPKQTNIPPNQHWGAAPQIIYDQKRDLVIALSSDRYSRPDEQNSLFIYTAKPDDVFNNPKGWKLQHELCRPHAGLNYNGNRPLNLNLYGYNTIAPINDQEYLVVFTERAKMHGTEQADLYYFRLLIN